VRFTVRWPVADEAIFKALNERLVAHDSVVTCSLGAKSR
jgi:hypothetical protein